ncbi:hypothetical protein BGX28_009978 [Mortierella sp. GBA30]|nr:hypothetical protein BGX28_009978 [Mortierella sp. GBA30]
MIATVVSPGSIPDFVHPPVPGESHDFYGDTHLDSIKLPAPATAEIIGCSIRSPAAQTDRPHDDVNLSGTARSHETGTIASTSIERAHNPVSNFTDTDQTDGSSDDVAWARLVEACINGNAEMVQEILLDSPQLKETIDNISSATGMNPLHFAASRGQDEVARILVDTAGAGVDIPDREGETALLKASYAGCFSVVCFLLKRGASVYQRDKDGWTALHNASSKGYIDIAQVLLEKGEADINARSKMGHTPLINAASKGDIPMVLYFLNHAKANPLLKNSFSEMAYDVAAANSEAYLCDILQSSERQWWKEWVIDKTDPNIDIEGWQYSKSLTEANQQWTAIPPTSGSNWVRRRKWIRVMKRRMDLITPSTDLLDDAEDGSTAMVQELAGNYMKRANLALRLDDGFSDSTQELARYRQSIQILLKGIKLDKDPASKLKSTALVQEYLQHAEQVALSIQEREVVADGVIRQLDTPRVAPRTSNGSPGSSNELRSLTLQKSRPSDVETMEALPVHIGHVTAGDSTEESSEDSFESASNSAGSENDGSNEGDMAENESQDVRQDPSTAANHLSQVAALDHDTDDHVASALSSDTHDGTRDLTSAMRATSLSSAEWTQEEASVGTEASPSNIGSDTHQSSVNIPTSTSTQDIPEVTAISSSAATAQSDPFPMARLTRSPRSGTTTPSSSRSNVYPSVPQSSSASIIGSQPPSQPEPRPAPLRDSGSESGPSSTPFSPVSHAGPSHAPITPPSARSGFPESPRQFQSNIAGANNVANQDRSSRNSSIHTHRQAQIQQQQYHSPPPLTDAKWELDSKATECRECHRKFSLWVRRHHCRRCGHVVCDRCSGHRSVLHPSMVVYDPTSSEALMNHLALSRRGTLQSYRVCDSCFATVGSGRSLTLGTATASGSGSGSGSGSHLQYHRSYHGQSSSASTGGHHPAGSIAGSPAQMDGGLGVYLQSSSYGRELRSHSSSRSSSSSNLHPAPMVRNASSSSLMSECPVCGAVLAGLEGGKPAQEAHVQDCLEGKPGQGSGHINNVRYIVYKLPADSPLVEQECAICFDEFIAGENYLLKTIFVKTYSGKIELSVHVPSSLHP